MEPGAAAIKESATVSDQELPRECGWFALRPTRFWGMKMHQDVQQQKGREKMKKAIIALACLGLLAGVANANEIRLYLSESDTAPDMTVTPTIMADAAPVTLYLWADVTPGDKWIGISLNVDIDGAGPALIDDSIIYDRMVMGVLPSWNPGSDFDFAPDNYAAVAAVTEQGLGGVLDVPDFEDSYIIGELTLDCLEEGATDLYLTVGASGVARQGALPGEDTIYFGWGDAGVASNEVGVRTALPEAIVCVPEPASLILLSLVGLVLRRR